MLALVTENSLDEWVRGNARDAQGVIVELVWRLVAASCPNPRERRFPLGDSIGQHGPDGILDVDLGFDPFVPEGKSLWEIGTGHRAGDKATSDYKELTESVPEDVRHASVFVFVTPLSARKDWEHTWKEEAQGSWLQARQNKLEWREVRIIDGTKLVEWTHSFPAVELWLSTKILGLRLNEIEIPEDRWAVLKSIGEPPPLIPRVFLVNREEACKKLTEIFDDKSVQLKLATHFPNQAIDFLCAYLASLDEERRIGILGRCVIISGSEAWNKMCDHWRNLILVADVTLDLTGDLGTRMIQKARRAGHAVIFGAPYGGLPDPASVLLPKPREHQIQEALEQAGYPEQRARTLAGRCDGNLGSLLRLLQNLSVLPAWAEHSDAADLAIAAVIGSWAEGSKADCAVVEAIAGKPYGEWIGKVREVALSRDTPLIQRDGKWKFISRYEGWYSLGKRLFDDHLKKLRHSAVSLLREKDPQFELPPEERYAASVYGKILTHSRLVRQGFAESLALLGSHPKALVSCSPGNPELTATLAVREILSDADWVLWGSIGDLLPLLAEASPTEFLGAVEKALCSDCCPFDELFSQEYSGGVFSRVYITGLLWGLETLAWDPNFLIRVTILLGELAARDPGGQWANRPINSLTTIFLPWLPQTCAPTDKRVVAVNALLDELPEIGWKLVLSLLPQYHSASSGTRRPEWRVIIPDEWERGVTNLEYWEQVSAYSELAITAAKQDVSKLSTLIDHLSELPQPAHLQLLEHLNSDTIVGLPEEERRQLWAKLVELVAKHRKFSETQWAMDSEQVARVSAVAERLAPSAPFQRHQRLFGERDLYEKKGDYEEQSQQLSTRREKAVEEVLTVGGIEDVLRFAKAVPSPWRVGIAFGGIGTSEADTFILPCLLLAEEKELKIFTGGYVRGRFFSAGWQWVDSVSTTGWTPDEIGQFLSFLPFTSGIWDRSRQLLKEDESAYWRRTDANAYEAEGDLYLAVEKLIENERPNAAISALRCLQYRERTLNPTTTIKALLAALRTPESPKSIDAYDIVEIIKALQEDSRTNQDDLFKIEWSYLPLLDNHNGGSPKLLWERLATDTKFFMEIIRIVYRSTEDEPAEEATDDVKRVATNAYRLLHDWQWPPGSQKDGTLNGESLKMWVEEVKADASESGHFEVAMLTLGHVLIHAPHDPDGLWIHKSVAAVLNAKDAENARNGYRSALYNSRGVHWVDPTGKPEKELATKYRCQAEDVERGGYHRFAVVLRELAEEYDREAERISSRSYFEG